MTEFGVSKSKQETLEMQQGLTIAHPAYPLPLWLHNIFIFYHFE